MWGEERSLSRVRNLALPSATSVSYKELLSKCNQGSLLKQPPTNKKVGTIPANKFVRHSRVVASPDPPQSPLAFRHSFRERVQYHLLAAAANATKHLACFDYYSLLCVETDYCSKQHISYLSTRKPRAS